jgi:hypothetical protein
MSGYSKLFSSIIHSTVWREPDHIRLVWITMLAMKDRDGIVEASIPGLADAARVGITQCEEALLRLSSPDPYSRTPNNEGRRISDVPGGWEILNHEIYQEKDSPEDRNRKNAEKQKRYRERLRERKADNASCDGGNTDNALRSAGNALPDVTGCYQALHTTDADTATDTEENTEEENPSNIITPSKVELKSQKSLLENDKTSNTKVKNDKTSKVDITALAKKYLDIFNSVFGRTCGARSIVEKKIKARLKDDIADWQILCAPILQMAMDPNTHKVRNFGPDTLLRDGKHPRRGENGATYGKTDWIERIYMSADRQQLDERLTSIVAHYSLTEHIQRTGCKLAENMDEPTV